MIKARCKDLLARYDALTQRERGLIAAALLGGCLLVGNSVFVDLPLARAKAVSKQLETERAELQMLEGQLLVLQQSVRDPNNENRARLPGLKSELQALREALAQHEKQLVAPQAIPALLERLVARHSALRLVALTTLPGTRVNLPDSPAKGEKAEAASAGDGLAVWKHGVEIHLQGSYAELTAYVADLENLPQRLLWGDVRLKADYPNSDLHLQIYTYSLDQAWLKL